MADESQSPSLDSLIGGNGRARDESNGRFVSATPAEPEKAPVVETKTEITPAVVTAPVVTEPVKQPAPVVTQPTESEAERGLRSSLLEERRKRQSLEQQLREREPPAKPVDPSQDLPGALQKQRDELEDRMFAQLCHVTTTMIKKDHPDYDEVQAAFLEACEAQPHLRVQLRQSENPAEFAYSEGTRAKELKEVGGNFVAYRSKLEKDIRAKVEAEFAAKGHVPAVPKSLNTDGSPVVAAAAYAGPPPLNTLIGPSARR